MSPLLFRILMFAIVAAGIYILVKVIRMLKNTFNGKVIAEIPFTEKQADFQLTEQGIYAIWQKGQLFRKTPLGAFKLKVTDHLTGSEVPLKPTWFQLHSNGFDTGRTELKKFSAQAGNYSLQIMEQEVPKLIGLVLGAVPFKPVEEDKYFIQIRESQPVYYVLFAIPLLSIAGFMMIGGLVAAIAGPQIATDFGIALP
jgi:hypothetical protein